MDGILVSRCDKLGDLVLSLPTLGILRDSGVPKVWLHTSAYAKPIGLWAVHNSLAAGVWAQGDEPPDALVEVSKQDLGGLALFHCPEAVRAFKALHIKKTLGPRTRLNAVWNYRNSVSQHRSRVVKSEMNYNVDLARSYLTKYGVSIPAFRGLPALSVPSEWKSPLESADLVIIAANGGSALNWPMSRYLDVAREAVERDGKAVQFLIHGADAVERTREFKRAKIAAKIELLPSFTRLEELIAHLAGSGEIFSSSTGPLHIAHALGKPVTGLYPKEPRVQSFKRWRPDGYWHTGPVRWIHL